MNPTLFEIGIALFLLAVSVAPAVWFFKFMAVASRTRLAGMVARAGMDAEGARSGDTEAIMRDVRSRCRRCQYEDLCDRWLAGKVEGDNSFCPNAQILRSLAKTAARAIA